MVKKEEAMRLGNRHISFVTALVLAGGLLAGILVPELAHAGTGSYAGLVSLYGLGEFEAGNIKYLSLFPEIFSGRLRTILFLWMSCYTPPGLLFHLLYFFWLCFSAGLLLAVFILRNGCGGAVLFFCCLFPQWLLYGSMLAREYRFLCRKRGALYPKKEEENASYREDWTELGYLILICAAGTAIESFFGLRVFRIFLRYL